MVVVCISNSSRISQTSKYKKTAKIPLTYYEKKAALKKFNLLDYGNSPVLLPNLIDLDTRIKKYLDASRPELPEWLNFSGGSKQTRNSCGKVLGLMASVNHPEKTLVPFVSSCNKLGCKVCAEKVSDVKARTIAQQIKDIQTFLFLKGYPRCFLVPRHLVFSHYASDFFWSYESLEAYKTDIKDFIKKYLDPYFIGSVVFTHPFRFKDPDIREHLKHSQHIHVIVFGGKLPHYDLFAEKYGFRYFNKGYLNSDADVKRCASYCLSHTAFPIDVDAERILEWTDSQKNRWKKDNDWLAFLGGIPTVIPDKNVIKKPRSLGAYFYQGALKPHNKRFKKIPKSKLFPKGIKKLVFRRGLRDLDTNELLYEVLEGFIFFIKDKNGFWKRYNADEFKIRSPNNREIIKYELCKSKLKFGRLMKEKKHLNWLESIRNLKSVSELISEVL